MFLKCQNKCDDSIKRSKCTIFNQYALYEPPHQFGGPDSFQAKHCGKSKDVLKFVCIFFFIVQRKFKSLMHKHIKPPKNYSHKYNCFVNVWISHLELFFVKITIMGNAQWAMDQPMAFNPMSKLWKKISSNESLRGWL